MLPTAVLVMLLTLIPYGVGYALSEDRYFLWLGYNLDDSCVYLSWMQQASQGALRAYNLFTTDPQGGTLLNPFFLLLGQIGRVTGIPLIGVYHGARLLLGVLFFYTIWWFTDLITTDASLRRRMLLFVAFSSGLGWLPHWWDTPPLHAPIDTWQPEAITFLSLLLSPLFIFSLCLQIAILGLLYLSTSRRNYRHAVLAGAMGFVLGLTHSYDVLSVSAVWGTYLLFQTFQKKGAMLHAWMSTAIAGALTAPAVFYIYFQYRTEAVFRARADVATLSPPLHWVIIGYGGTLLLAILGIRALRTSSASHSSSEGNVTTTPIHTTSPPAVPFLVVWMVINIAVAYAPGLAFQRKMLQGAHIPIALLAAAGASHGVLPRLPASLRTSPFTMPALLFLLALTNLRFVSREIMNYAANRSQTGQHRTSLQPGEIQALKWIREHTPPGSNVQPLPWVIQITQQGRIRRAPYDMTLACLTPGMTGRKVYCGHWGETPNYGTRLLEVSSLLYPETTDAQRTALLRRMKVQYLIFSQREYAGRIDNNSAQALAPFFQQPSQLPLYLELVYQNRDASVFRVINL
ncbi:MAG: hypothetical protein RMJ43_13030 [Chloroherpetonaceae bacterium]|nr:hypothetical protein [Chthonomonadaceae bacterium]MDW8208751.1 hypothetical protein [Chloroherpetonaceae bacterium]